jgi:hypothetical protein
MQLSLDHSCTGSSVYGKEYRPVLQNRSYRIPILEKSPYLIGFDYQAPEELLTELLHGEQNEISEIILEHLTTNLIRNCIKRIAQPSRITQCHCRLSQYLSHCKFIILDE